MEKREGEGEELSVAGVRRVLQPGQHWLRRVVWGTVLVCSVCATAYLSTGQVLLYFTRPTTATVSISSSSTIPLPAVTICLRDKYDFHNLLELWRESGQRSKLPRDADFQLVRESNLTLEQIWQHGGYRLKDLVKKCYVGPGGLCEERGTWKSTLTRYGKCFTFSGAVTSKSGKLFGIHLLLGYRGHPYGIPFGGYMVAVHNSLQPVPLAIEDGISCTQKLTKTKHKLGCHRLVSVTVQTIHLLSGKTGRCSDVVGYSTGRCRTNCLYTYILRRYKCRLPYMEVKGRLCDSVEEIEALEAAMHNLFFKGNFNYSACHCPPACASIAYHRSTDTTWNVNKNSIIKIFLEGAETEEVSEKYTYGIPALISQIGGFMGLLMGASSLILIQATELLIHVMGRLFKRVFAYCLSLDHTSWFNFT